VRRVSAGGDEMPGHATRRQVITGVLVPRGVRAGTNAGRRRQWPAPHCLHPKSDGPPFGVREKWRRSGVDLLRLLRISLRYQPDRILVGEVRGPEALALLEA